MSKAVRRVGRAIRNVFNPKMPKLPEIEPPAPAPQAAEVETPQLEIGGEERDYERLRRRRRGKGALRIDLQAGGTGMTPGAAGVNVPMK